jgi:mono/diheme cytochrome c family protein
VKRVAAAVLAAMLVAFAAAGCGRSAGASHVAALQRGSAIFADSCSGCHTLAGRESGASGGDLVKAHLSVAALVSFTEVMPARRPLSQTEVMEVAEFVHAVAGR